MRDTLRSILVTILIIGIVVLVLKGLFFILPYLIIVAIVFYIISRIKGKFNRSKSNYKKDIIKDESKHINKEERLDNRVIDVDYTDVEK